MPRSYRNILMYENEILELKGNGKSLREIGELLGFSTNKYTTPSLATMKSNAR